MRSPRSRSTRACRPSPFGDGRADRGELFPVPAEAELDGPAGEGDDGGTRESFEPCVPPVEPVLAAGRSPPEGRRGFAAEEPRKEGAGALPVVHFEVDDTGYGTEGDPDPGIGMAPIGGTEPGLGWRLTAPPAADGGFPEGLYRHRPQALLEQPERGGERPSPGGGTATAPFEAVRGPSPSVLRGAEPPAPR